MLENVALIFIKINHICPFAKQAVLCEIGIIFQFNVTGRIGYDF